MKIAVINFSGNVGKSIVSRHLLSPRMENAALISVESINSDGTNNETIKGKEFSDIMDKVMTDDNVIIDIGASNVEEFMKQMRGFIGSQEDFDYFLVPTVKSIKQLTDTISTIKELNELDIPADKIKVVFNMVDRDDVISRQFIDLIEECNHLADINHKAIIYENELFTRLNNTGCTISQLVDDETDYKSLIMQTDDKKKNDSSTHSR